MPIYAYQREQGTALVFTDESTVDNVIFQPHLTMTAISWLPNENFVNDLNGGSLDGYPIFAPDKPYELIWTYKDNTQTPSQKEDSYYETKVFGTVNDGAQYGMT